MGMGLGPIPFTAILEYMEFRGIEEKEDFITIIRAMDDAYLAGHHEARKKKESGGVKKSTDPNHNSKISSNGGRGRKAKGTR